MLLQYEPSTWSGLHYYMLMPKVTLTIFRSGNFNMKGELEHCSACSNLLLAAATYPYK